MANVDAGRPAAIELRRRVLACCQRHGMSADARLLLETRLTSTFYDLNCNVNAPCVMITLVLTDSRAQDITWMITIDADGPDTRGHGEHFGYTVERDGVRVSGNGDNPDDSHVELPEHTLWAVRPSTSSDDPYNTLDMEGESVENPNNHRRVAITGTMYTLKLGFSRR